MSLFKKPVRIGQLFSNPRTPFQRKIGVFETYIEADGVSISWADIRVITAYKIDLLTVDEIRMLVRFGTSDQVMELSEEQEGFDEFVRAAATMFSFPDGWWERLAKPAFEKGETTLFQREQP
jgi:hypothetical protein